MKIDKNIDFGGARNKRTWPSNSTRKTTYIDLFSCPYDRKWSKTLPVNVRKRSYVSVHNRMYASVFYALVLHIGVVLFKSIWALEVLPTLGSVLHIFWMVSKKTLIVFVSRKICWCNVSGAVLTSSGSLLVSSSSSSSIASVMSLTVSKFKQFSSDVPVFRIW